MGIAEKLVKSCKSEHLLYSGLGKKLQIGSLDSYRNLGDDELRDTDEGFLKFDVTFPEVLLVSQNWLNDITFGRWGQVSTQYENNRNCTFEDFNFLSQDMSQDSLPGYLAVNFKYINIISNTQDGVLLSGKIEILYKPHNCLAFCCHKFPIATVPNVSMKPFSKYNAYWELDFAHEKRFNYLLAIEVAKKIDFHNINYVAPSKIDVKNIKAINVFDYDGLGKSTSGLNLMYRGAQVEYRERSFVVMNEQDVTPASVKETLSFSAFFKPKRFQENCEYRTVFYLFLQSGQNFIPVSFVGDYLRVPTVDISKLVENHLIR